jgi:uncharacterized protein GlcG (DUF336 family)
MGTNKYDARVANEFGNRAVAKRASSRKPMPVRSRRSALKWSAVLAAAAAAASALTPSSAHALGLITTHRISASLALEAVSEAVAACAKQGFHVTALVVDVDGVKLALLRGDGAPIHTVDGVYGKTYVAASLAPLANLDTSAAMAARVAANPALGGLQFLPNISLIPGAVTIKAGDEVVGAIGVAGGPGGNYDETCARAGLDKIKDRLQ